MRQFAIVTSFEFYLHAMSRQVLAGNLFYPIDRLRDILEFYAEFSLNAPDELATDLIFGYPNESRPGFVLLALCYCGDPKMGNRVMAAVEKLGEPMMVVAQLDQLEFVGRVDDRDISFVEEGMVGALDAIGDEGLTY